MQQGALSPSNHPAHVPDRSGEDNLVELKGRLNQGELCFDQILWMKKLMAAPATISTVSL